MKIILPLAGVAIAASIVGVALIHKAQTHQRQRHLQGRASAITHALEHVAETAATAGQLQRFVASLASESGVELIVVAAGDPLTVVASSRPDWCGQLVATLPDAPHTRRCLENALTTQQPRLDLQHNENGTVDYSLPLRTRLRQNNAISWSPGAAMLHLDGISIRREQNADTAKLIAAFLSAIGLSCLVAYILLWRVVIRPVGKIVEVAKTTVAGTQKVRVRWSRSDELGQLGMQFDHMLDEIDAREKQEQQARQQAIDAQRAAEVALAELTCFKFALDQHAIVAVTDRRGVITYANDRFCEISKYTREELVGQTHRILNSGHHPAGFFRNMWTTIQRGEVWREEVCNLAKDGRIYWVDTTVVPFTDSAGEVTQFVAIRADISDRKRAEKELLEEQSRLAAFVEYAPAAIVMLDREMRCVAVSRRYISDRHLEGQSIVGRHFYDTMPHLPERWKKVNERGLQGEVTVCDEDVWRPDGSEEDLYLRWEVRPWRLADGQIGGILIFTENITEKKRTEDALLESKEQFELAVRGSSDGIWDWNIQSGVFFYSQRYKELLGYSGKEEFPDRFESFEKHLHPVDAPATLRALREHLRDGVPFDVTFRLRTAEGQWRWFRSRGEAVRGSDGQARRMAGSISDISSLKKVEEELTRAARLDRLTGLPNRGLFLDRLQQAIQRSNRAQKYTYAVMFLDFDRFKNINDSLGHDVGDALLVEIANKLRNHIRASDSLSANMSGHLSGRLGGDEFVVLLDELDGVEDAELIASQLLDAFTQPHQLGKHEVYATASIGIVVGDPTYERAEDVIRDADTAMYEAKRRGKARYVVFDASMRERVQRHMTLESDLRKAIGQPQLTMRYQPIVSLQNGSLYGVEALMRWTHPTQGVIDPTEFIPIAEESDLILMLGEWAIEQSCRQMAEWQESMDMLAPKRMCINLSRKQFGLPHLPQQIEEIMTATGANPCQIQFEVTEDAFVGDIGAAVKTMQAIRGMGCELAIDGFGSGTSSFASLHQFPVDVLKIDRSMLAGIEDSNDVASMIHGLAVMVKNLGIDLVAEGVGTPGQVIALQELGCDFAQGSFFAEALSTDEMRAFANRSLSLDCNTRGAVAYANQWGDRLAVFESFTDSQP